MTHLTPRELRELLGPPGGLQKAAQRYGAFVLNSWHESIITYTLPSAVRDSSLIVAGSVVSMHSRLLNHGNDIVTDCAIHPDQVLKGVQSGDVTFMVEGGRVQFANGTSAEVMTDDWKPLKIGDRYVAMLRRDGDTGEYMPINGAEGLFHVVPATGVIDPMCRRDGQPHGVVPDSIGLSYGSFLSKIRRLASEK